MSRQDIADSSSFIYSIYYLSIIEYYYFVINIDHLIIMQDTCILVYIKNHFHAHCDVISDEYITDKVQKGEGQKYSELIVQIRHFW